ncbi:LAME_0E06656g1_1 [Lachancea meyersii CBS 8951]|uniref:LAME_0E06656g1_1 n=1 Tax=Lachancea meyersii CBS 8951 TaxID=1266667 RepID=A0A1G4JID1_9SACH|nr:LAME_0E06656g1_1 [Lachancea meyersii CBS 8951]
MISIPYKRIVIAFLGIGFLVCQANWSHQQHIELNNTVQENKMDLEKTGKTAFKRAEEDELFCAVMNPLTGNYVDLSELSTTPNMHRGNSQKKYHNGHNGHNGQDWQKTRWLVKEPDTHLNYTLGICSSATRKSLDSLANSTGAFFVDPESHQEVSIGDYVTQPRFVGKKLTMAYENGDLCPNGVDRRATLLSFVCDKEIQSKAQISYVGSLHNCSYYFEVRSVYACPTSHKSNDVNVLGIFFGIFLVFFVVEWGRRWFYGRVRARLRHGGEAGFMDSRPHWDTIERPSRLRRILKRVFRFPAPSRTAGIKLSTTAQYHNPSTESLTRDIEAQNNLLDNLDVASASSR